MKLTLLSFAIASLCVVSLVQALPMPETGAAKLLQASITNVDLEKGLIPLSMPAKWDTSMEKLLAFKPLPRKPSSVVSLVQASPMPETGAAKLLQASIKNVGLKKGLIPLSIPAQWDISMEKLLAFKPLPHKPLPALSKSDTVHGSANLPKQQSTEPVVDLPARTSLAREHVGVQERAKFPMPEAGAAKLLQASITNVDLEKGLIPLSMPAKWEISMEKLLAFKPSPPKPSPPKPSPPKPLSDKPLPALSKYDPVHGSASPPILPSTRPIVDVPARTSYALEHVGVQERAKFPFTYTHHRGMLEAKAEADAKIKQRAEHSLFQHQFDVGRTKEVAEKGQKVQHDQAEPTI